MSATTILVYGPSGSGKTPQIGLLAEHVKVTTGKNTRVYSADFGGTDTIDPYIDLGIIELVEIGKTTPWVFLNKATQGYIRDASGKWILDQKANDQIGFYAFESAHGLAQLMKMDMENKAASGTSVGGDTNTSFEVQGDGEKLKIGTTKGYQKYQIPQSEVLNGMYRSFTLNAEYVMWTAGINKDEDDVMIAAKVVGPDVIGRALTGILQKDFNYTFRISTTPAKDGKAEEHTLFLGTHIDAATGNAAAAGNIRRPLDAPEIDVKNLFVKPANIVKALQLVKEQAKEVAKAKIKARMEAATKKVV